MPAKDLYHENVVHALQKDGWTITDDPLKLKAGGINTCVDLGAERTLIGAERGTERIAAEIKSFLSRSQIADLQQAIGQFFFYKPWLAIEEPERILYLAVPEASDNDIFNEPLGRIYIEQMGLRVFAFDPVLEEITKWRP